MFLTIRASFPFLDAPLRRGDSSIDFPLGNSPLAEDIGVEAVCFFREGYSGTSLTVKCCEVLKVVLP
jgi:hypothetical protein